MRAEGGALRKENEPQSAAELLQERLGSLIDDAANNMTDEEFTRAADQADAIIEKARARAARREKG